MDFRYCKRFIKSIFYLEFYLILEFIMFIELCKINKLVMHLNPSLLQKNGSEAAFLKRGHRA